MADLEQILEVEKAIKGLRKAMARLSGRLINQIDREAAGEDFLDSDHLDVWDAYASCQTLLPPLQRSREFAEEIIRNSGAGSISPRTGEVRKPRAPASDDTLYLIASALAEVYLFWVRAYPKPSGTDADTGAPNTLFNKTLCAILHHEGYKTVTSKTIVNMANAARRDLSPAKVKASLRANAATLYRWRSSSVYSITTRGVIWRDMKDEEYGLWAQIMALETGDEKN